MSHYTELPKVIIGLGNPEIRFLDTRHNAGFKVLDALATRYDGSWRSFPDRQVAHIYINEIPVLLMKPLTYMNNSGDIVVSLKKSGFTAADSLVVHDELELPKGKLAFKMGGSSKGHNGLKSLIERWGTPEFRRLRVGIGRPDDRSKVADYVLQKFEPSEDIEGTIQNAVTMIEDLYM